MRVSRDWTARVGNQGRQPRGCSIQDKVCSGEKGEPELFMRGNPPCAEGTWPVSEGCQGAVPGPGEGGGIGEVERGNRFPQDASVPLLGLGDVNLEGAGLLQRGTTAAPFHTGRDGSSAEPKDRAKVI